MKKTKRFIIGLVLIGILVVLTTLILSQREQTKTVTILQTSDVHGMLIPYDYAADKQTLHSLAHAATIVAGERSIDPDLLLLDSGDITQGNSLQSMRGETPHPAIRALNYLDYDAWILGNHEFDFGYDSLCKSVDEFQGVTLAGNMYKDGERVFPVSHMFDVDGVKVAIIGLTSPYVPVWAGGEAARYNEAAFTVPGEEIEKALGELEGKADIIIAAVHYGPDGEYGDTGMRALAEQYCEQIDGFLIGHSHAALEEEICGIPMLEPGQQGAYVSKLTFTIKGHKGAWEVIQRKGELLDCSEVEADASFLSEMADCDQQLRTLATMPIGTIGQTFLDPVEFLPGIPTALIQDNPLIDFINDVQLFYTGADVSCAALFDINSNLVSGPFYARDGVSIYPYENELVTISLTGAQLKIIMEEYAGKLFQTYKPGDVTIAFDPEIRIYKFDQFAGVDYEIDISQPVGKRIKNIYYHNEPLQDDQQLTMATTDYRYGAFLSDGILTEDQLLCRDGQVRDRINEYVAAQGGVILPGCDNNWRVVGAELDDPQKELIYEMVRKGELSVPISVEDRAFNVKALNGPELRANGILPALD